jgi:FkbM family methyltransferase
MMTQTAAQVQSYTLPDGREIACTSTFNTSGVWEEFSSGLYQRCVSRLLPGDCVVDVGAHVGLVSLLIADAIGGGRFVACEPAPPTFACLQRNFARYLPGGVAVNVALGAAPGAAVLTYYPHSEVMTTLHADVADDDRNIDAALASFGVSDPKERAAFARRSRSDPMKYLVRVATLAQLFVDHDLHDVGLLKIDVERAELDVLLGLDESAWHRVRNIIAEVHDIDGRLALVVSMLEGRGFAVENLQQDMYSGASTHTLIASR